MEVNDYVRPHLKKLKAYQAARNIATEGVFLDANEYPNDPSQGDELNRYPDPYQRGVRELIAQREGIENNQVLVTSGSDEGLDLLFKLFLNPREAVMTTTPSYGMYRVLADTYDVDTLEIPLDEDFGLNLTGMQQALHDQVKLVFICHPNNPTGNLLDREKMEDLLKLQQFYLVVDEAYIDFSKKDTVVSLLKEYSNLIILRTFSKAYGLAGLRCGYLLSNASVIDYLDKVKLPYNVNTVTLAEVEKRLADPSYLEKNVKYIQEEKAKLEQALQEFDWIAKIYPSASNFILCKVKGAGSFYDSMRKEGIVLRKRSEIEEGIRITVGSQDENQLLLEKMKAYRPA